MIYSFLKIFTRLTIWGYFKKVKIVGKEKIPKKGPYIFVSNHPSAFMDPIVVATYVKPPVYFVAAGEYVGTGFKGWVFKHALHMIPVFRPDTRPEETHKNQDMFIKCHEHLNKKGALLIFPEGVSLTEKKLKPLKTGTVRIAFGAEELSNFKLNVPIIPIGLNYSDPHTFRSDLFIKVGDPIYIRTFLEKAGHKVEEEIEDQIQLTKDITAFVESEMQKTILHIGSDEEELMLNKLETIFARDVKAALGISFQDQEEEFQMQKIFIDAIAYFKESRPILYEKTEIAIDAYLEKLKKNKLLDKDIGEFHNRQHNKRVLSFIIGLPYFLFGFIHNYIPYRLVGFLSKKMKLDTTFSGSITLAFGLFIFLGWYIGLTFFAKWILVDYGITGWLALLYPVIMYITGVYALLYATAIRNSRQRINLRKIIKSDQNVLTQLIEDRKAIISTLVNCQKDYLLSTK